eukprot:TRINITY_DN25827_c0_g1_i2.p1 TRINITY_DN25827_c0_g1~~TRINITY_DN25827_c0_g1_i2.p1  ORF type:complete len:395 (-),score=61.33 TRINITY_DN25827_c0_g1_i2:299-1483(-)
MQPDTTRKHRIPTAGFSIPELSSLDTLMSSFMERHDLSAGTLAISRNGVIVYDRKFGWQDAGRSIPIRPDAIGRVASLSKPVTAAAVHRLVEDGVLRLDQPVFDLGHGDGVLKIAPLGTPDGRLKDVTVEHLLHHRGGWKTRGGDLSFMSRQAAEELGVPSPPSRGDMARWVMGQALQYTPGTDWAYSNVGYMLLGLVIEQTSGMDFEAAVQSLVFEAAGVSPDRVRVGANSPDGSLPTEWFYDSNGSTSRNIQYPHHSRDPTAPSAFGGWDFKGHCAQGGIVTDAAAMLALAAHRNVGLEEGIGARRRDAGGWKASHRGSHPGSNSMVIQRGDGFDVCVVFNRMPQAWSDEHHGSEVAAMVDHLLDERYAEEIERSVGGHVSVVRENRVTAQG